MTAWSNPQPVGISGGLTIVADLGDGLGHDALVAVLLTKDYATHHPPGFPFRDDPGEHSPGETLWLLKPEVDAIVAAGVGVTAGTISVEPPANTAIPYACGADGKLNANVGETVSVTTGEWTNRPNSYEYQWKRATGSNINVLPDATGPTYVPVMQDKSKSIFCTLVAINEAGAAAVDSNYVHILAVVETSR